MTFQVGTGHDITMEIASGSKPVKASLTGIVSQFETIDNSLEVLFSDADDESEARKAKDTELTDLVSLLSADHDDTIGRVIVVEALVETVNSDAGPIKVSANSRFATHCCRLALGPTKSESKHLKMTYWNFLEITVTSAMLTKLPSDKLPSWRLCSV